MGYQLYIDDLLFPVAPSKITTKIKNQNKTHTLINGNEYSVLKSAGLSDYDFDVLLPNVRYPFAQYEHGFQKAKYYTDKLEMLKGSKLPFRLKVIRILPTGESLCTTDQSVSLEEYTITEDAKNLFDWMVKISLKQYEGIKSRHINVDTGSAQEKRESDKSPAPKTLAKSYTVLKGDCLWLIAKKYYGNGNKFPTIYTANKGVIDGRNKGTGNDKYTIYVGQVLTIPV